MFVFQNCNFTCITDIWYGFYASKIDVFFWESQFYQAKLKKTYKNNLKRPQGGQRQIKSNQNLSWSLPGGQGFGVLPPFFAKMSVHRARMGPQKPPNSRKMRPQNHCFSQLVVGTCFWRFLMSFGGLNPSESCSHAGRTPDFEKSTFSALAGFFSRFWPTFGSKSGVWNH